MAKQKRNLKNMLDSLIDDEGLRTEVNITMTTSTLINIIAGLVVGGGSIVVIAHLAKKWFPSAQLKQVNENLTQIKQALKQ